MKNLPIVAYTAYTDQDVKTVLEQVSAENVPDLYFCRSIEELLRKVFEILPAARAEAIRVPPSKPPTDI